MKGERGLVNDGVTKCIEPRTSFAPVKVNFDDDC